VPSKKPQTYIDQIVDRIETIANDAYSSCKQGIAKEDRVMMATVFWSMTTATYLALLLTRASLPDRDLRLLTGAIPESFGDWLDAKDAIEITDDPDPHKEKFNEYTAALLPEIIESFHVKPKYVGEHLNMIDAAPELKQFLLDEKRKSIVSKGFGYAAYVPFDDFQTPRQFTKMLAP
jgi:hypothetical protein